MFVQHEINGLCNLLFGNQQPIVYVFTAEFKGHLNMQKMTFMLRENSFPWWFEDTEDILGEWVKYVLKPCTVLVYNLSVIQISTSRELWLKLFTYQAYLIGIIQGITQVAFRLPLHSKPKWISKSCIILLHVYIHVLYACRPSWIALWLQLLIYPTKRIIRGSHQVDDKFCCDLFWVCLPNRPRCLPWSRPTKCPRTPQTRSSRPSHFHTSPLSARVDSQTPGGSKLRWIVSIFLNNAFFYPRFLSPNERYRDCTTDVIKKCWLSVSSRSRHLVSMEPPWSLNTNARRQHTDTTKNNILDVASRGKVSSTCVGHGFPQAQPGFLPP